ncbi:MAG: PIN domain-containing protein, partial [Actinomycetota bacterium]
GYLIERRLGPDALDVFLDDLERVALTLECGEEDLPRIRVLVRRYADLQLGFADASVVACAERNGGKVLTLDRRDFDVVAGEGRLTVLP